MIVRIFRVVVYDDSVDDFKDFLSDTALPFLREQAGLVSVQLGLPRPETPTEFCLIMTWDSAEALAAAVGSDWRKPYIHPEETGIVKERHVHHYELAETDG